MDSRLLCLILILVIFIRLVEDMKLQRFSRENFESSKKSQICEENEILYHVENTDEYVCDCFEGYIYYSKEDACFAAYWQGPCGHGEHIVLEATEKEPKCVTNPCDEGFARYNGTCYELNTPNGPCLPVSEGGGIFGVNVTTLKVECLQGTDRLSLFNSPSRCIPGSKRDRTGACRVIYD